MKGKISHIGLVAGDKNLPFLICDFARQNNVEISVMGIRGCVPDPLKKKVKKGSYREFYLSELSKTISFFKSQNVDTVVLVGGVGHAKIKPTFDLIRTFFKLIFMKNRYDGVLRLVISEFEKNGFHVVGIQDLMPELLIKKGVLTDVLPSLHDIDDAKFGFEMAKKFAKTDRGQSIIVQNKKVVAVEKFSGTDELINRSKKHLCGTGGILVKVLKPQQERRADIPVLGVNTIKNIASAGLNGVVIEADNAIIDDRENVIKTANDLGVFIIGSDGKFF